MKGRIAIFMMGGIGGGNFSQGFPKIVEIVDRLKQDYDLVVYSFSPIDIGFKPDGFKICDPPRWIFIRSFRWPYLIISFFIHHFKQNYKVLFSFWGYPMGWLTVMLSKITGKPSVVTILGSEAAEVPEINYGQLLRQPQRGRVIWTCENASALVVLTNYQVKKLKQHGLKRSDFFVVPFGVNADRFRFHASKFEGQLRIIHIANLTEVKDQATLVKAFALLKKEMKVKLRMVGGDYINGKIHLLVKELQLEDDVEFTGPVPYNEVPGQLQWANMALLTSLSEGQNNFLTEAAMTGLLLVSTPVGHVNDLGNDQVLIVNLADPEDIYTKIKAITMDSVEWNRKVTNARKWTEAYDLNYTIAKLKEVIDSL